MVSPQDARGNPSMKTPRSAQTTHHQPQLWRRGYVLLFVAFLLKEVYLVIVILYYCMYLKHVCVFSFCSLHFLWFCWTLFSAPIKIKSKFTIFNTNPVEFLLGVVSMHFHPKNSFFDLGDHFVSTQHFPQIKSLYPPGLECRKVGEKTCCTPGRKGVPSPELTARPRKIGHSRRKMK